MNRPTGPIVSEGEQIARETERWERETRQPSLAGKTERREEFVTQALKWPIKPLYTPADLEEAGFDYSADLGFPGEYPFTRSTRPNGHRTLVPFGQVVRTSRLLHRSTQRLYTPRSATSSCLR